MDDDGPPEELSRLVRKVKVEKSEGGQGLLTVTQKTTDDDDDARLWLRVATADCVYEISQTPSDLREKIKEEDEINNNHSVIETFVGYLSPPPPTAGAEPAANQLKIAVKPQDKLAIKVFKKNKSGIPKTLWSCELAKNENVSVFGMASSLVDSISRDQAKGSHVRDALSDLQQERDAWKQTAEDLEGRWENEKTRLFDNFLTLYKEKQAKIAAQQTSINELEESLVKAQEEAAATSAQSSSNNKRAAVARDDTIMDASVPIDGVALDAEQVADLAEGKQVQTKRKKAAPVKRVLARKPRKAAPRKKKAAAVAAAVKEEEDDDDDMKVEESPPAKRQQQSESTSAVLDEQQEDGKKEAPKVLQKKATKSNAYSSSDESDNEPAAAAAKKKKPPPPRAGGDRNPYSSSSEDDDEAPPTKRVKKEDESDATPDVEAALSGMRSEIFAALSSDDED